MAEFYSSDLPQDLSAKFKTVGVQTEDNKSSLEALQDVLTGLSEKQTRILLGVITSVLFKTEQNPNHYENSITELHQYRQRFGWTSLEPETPPISPPQSQSLLRLPAAAKPSLSVTPIHQSYFARNLEDLHHPQPGCSIVKCEEETKNIQTSIFLEDESVEGSMSSMSRDEKLVMEMQIPFTGEVVRCYNVATFLNIKQLKFSSFFQWTKSSINQWRSLMTFSPNILSVKRSSISAEISEGAARTRSRLRIVGKEKLIRSSVWRTICQSSETERKSSSVRGQSF